jgi:hypothetical protein
MAYRLLVDSANYFKIDNLHRSDGEAISSVTAKTAWIEDVAGTKLDNSEITLSAVDGDDDAYEGTFPETVSLTDGERYVIVVSITADDIVLKDKHGVYATADLNCTDASSVTCPNPDIDSAIGAIEEAMFSGVSQVTVDGQTLTYRSLDELDRIRRKLVARDRSGKRKKRPTSAQILLGGI